MSAEKKSASARITKKNSNPNGRWRETVFLPAFLMEETNMYDDSYYDYLDYIEGRCMNDSKDCVCQEEDDDEDS